MSQPQADRMVPAEEAELVLRGIISAVEADEGLSAVQRGVLNAVGRYVLQVDRDPAELEPLSPEALADALPDPVTRQRMVHAMTVLELVAQPVPAETVARVQQYAAALGVDEPMLAVARDYAQGAMDLAVNDMLRNSYPVAYAARTDQAGTASPAPQTADPALAARWEALADCPAGSLGRTVWDFYLQRGFTVPGTPGSVSPLLAQHDWVHCLADYGTSPTGELEVFSFISAAIPDPRGFSYSVTLIGLFETGYVPAVPGVATANPGHLAAPGGAVRFADAVRRGLPLHLDVMGGTDWFAYADDPIAEVRRRLGLLPKGDDSVAAGSLSALDPDAVFGRSS